MFKHNMAYEEISALLGMPTWAFYLVIIWSLIWKGLALWRSGRLNQPVWFVVLLVVNTLGILEILYLFVFSKMKMPKKGRKK